MPIVELNTNVKVADVKEFTIKLNKASAAAFGMDGYVTCSYQYNESIIFAGTHDPAFVLRVTTLGNPVEKNEGFAKSLFSFFSQELGIPDNRGYIIFNDPTPVNLAHRSTTFAVLLK
ncbi:hypothetical protein H0H92_011212 [Tricholoma furcatifolium]|nr:hypothetical protein H0H92_011212 [Tricholoma furcatifolium]